MVDLPGAVDALVAAAKSQVEPRALKRIVEKVLADFAAAPRTEQDVALRTLGRALGKVDGRGAQILSLSLGALVEGGATPELAWTAIRHDLSGLLGRATAFASAVVKHAKDPHVDTAIELSGAVVAAKRPREAEAWKAVAPRCLAAVACLTRSKQVRRRARKTPELENACWPLSDAVSEIGYLLQALRILDDEELIVVAPVAGRGWRVTVDGLASNAELYILLADALVGDPRKKQLAGKPPNAKAVTAILEGTRPPKGASSVRVPFHLVDWTALGRDGSLSPANADEADHVIRMEGIPADIPRGPGNKRVVVLQQTPYTRPIPVAPSFESLRPRVRVVAELSGPEVGRMLLKLGKAAEDTLSSDTDRARPRTKRRRPTKKT